MIDITNLSRAAVLAALYNASKPQGMGFMQYDPKPMTESEAEELLTQNTYFDYLKGRVMKVDLSKDEFSPHGYDRDNGEGAAMAVVLELVGTGSSNSPRHQTTHTKATLESLYQTEKAMQHDHSYADGDNFHLGLSDMEPHLKPAIEWAKKEN